MWGTVIILWGIRYMQWLTEHLIKIALKNKNINYKEKAINYELELKSLNSFKAFINKKTAK